eukprot:7383823-Prymnesium_polylepis.1
MPPSKESRFPGRRRQSTPTVLRRWRAGSRARVTGNRPSITYPSRTSESPLCFRRRSACPSKRMWVPRDGRLL